MAVQQEEGWRRVLRELTALGLWALAFYALLSLVSHDARFDPNFGGALGDGLARNLERTFGFRRMPSSRYWRAWDDLSGR